MAVRCLSCIETQEPVRTGSQFGLTLEEDVVAYDFTKKVHRKLENGGRG